MASSDYTVHEEVRAGSFDICTSELGSIVERHGAKKLKFHGGVDGLAGRFKASPTDGLSTDAAQLYQRQEIFGINKLSEGGLRSFWMFVWEALQNMNLGVCAFVSWIVGIATEGWLKGSHDGLGIVATTLLVVLLQSLHCHDLSD